MDWDRIGGGHGGGEGGGGGGGGGERRSRRRARGNTSRVTVVANGETISYFFVGKNTNLRRGPWEYEILGSGSSDF
uniref:Uncharacterized protein n=1 Tax=Oryza glumipatula TaxID=40148 RepID=A0A0D9YI14_9ORYZ